MARIRFILVGAVPGLTWAAALRGYMMQLAGPTSTFTFSGTFGIILPTGTLVGALLGWAEYQRRAGRRYPLLIGAPLLLAILPSLLTADSTLLPWAWPCPRWSGATPCPAVARSGSGAWPASPLSAPSSLRLPPQAVPGPQRRHTVRRLGRHAGLVPVRGARPGLLHTNARTRSQPLSDSAERG